METSDLIRYAAETFDRLKIRYFVTGSVAAIFYGEPRFTNDVDIVVDLPFGLIHDFAAPSRRPISTSAKNRHGGLSPIRANST